VRVPATGEPSVHVLPSGATPLRIAAGSGRAWVARGEGGLLELDLASGAVRLGPDLSSLPGPVGFDLTPGFVADVALCGGTLLIAVGVAGVLAIDTSEPWPEQLEPTLLAPRTRTLAALRLAVQGDHVLVGGLRAPAAPAHGAPYHPLGVVGMDLEPGAVPREQYRLGPGRSELQLFRVDGTRLTRRERVALPECGFRELSLGVRGAHAMLTGLGYQQRERGRMQRVLHTRQAAGLPCISGKSSLLTPGLVLMGMDSQGSLVSGLPEVREQGLTWVRDLGFERRLGLIIGEPWLDEEGREWFVAGGGGDWKLWWRDTRGGRFEHVRLLPPLDEEGRRGASYFSSACVGGRLLLVRAGSREALLCVARESLCRRALAAQAGSTLELEPLWTWGMPGSVFPYAWEPVVLAGASERLLLVLPAGYDEQRRARTFVLELEDRGARVHAVLSGSQDSHCVSAAALATSEASHVLTGELDGSVRLFDLRRAAGERLVRTVELSACAPDGVPDGALDVELALRGDGRLRAFVANGRCGVVAFDALGGELERHATPGWAAGLTLRNDGGALELLVGDQKCGLRRFLDR